LKKIFFLIWENPSSHQIILPIIKGFSKFTKVYLISSLNKDIEFLDKKDSNFSKYCKHKKIPYFENYGLINKLSLFYFLIISFLNIIYNKPKYVYIINKYPLVLTFLIKLFLNTKIIYHNLDYDPFSHGLFQKILKKIEFESVKFIDLIIFSHKLRAKRFFKDSKNKKKSIIFYNSLPKGFYLRYKKKNNNIGKKKLFYFGSIGPGHGLLELIKSTSYMNKNLILEIYGWIVDKSYYLKMYEYLKKNNLNKKVIFKLGVKDFVWKSKMMEANLGIALYEVKSLSHKFMFPASQKINAYLAASLPILVSNTKDNQNFLFRNKCGIATDLQPKLIAKNVNLIFKKKNFYKLLKRNSRNAFINEFNFEKQFQKIKNQLIDL
tara:strand:- start:2626 stop:3759 length:1134 start_codon:yes stop_codon:yes gene_type:complete